MGLTQNDKIKWVEKFLKIQADSKNPMRLLDSYSEIFCTNKSSTFWVKLDFEDMEKVSSLKWKVDQKTKNGKTKTIGRYLTDKKAALAYNYEAEKQLGSFAKLNEVKI